ncbi:MAG: hypothetical protein ACOYOK_01985 [Pseudobdellovibrionaceae bacterium]
MDFDFLKKADFVTVQLEKAKRAVEKAKADLDSAKSEYEEVFAQAETHGFNKNKLKKITEDRLQSLIDSGLLEAVGGSGLLAVTAAKKDKPVVAKAKVKKESLDEENKTSEESATAEDLIQASIEQDLI